MNNVYNVTYIRWKGLELHSGGAENQFSKFVKAENHFLAAQTLRHAMLTEKIEIVSISKVAENVLG